MPYRAPSPCTQPGCPARAEPGTHRCAAHPYPPRPGSWASGTSGYKRNGWQWQRTRARVLARDGHRCRRCGAPAEIVDHVTAVAFGGSHEDWNLQALCAGCSAVKTQAEAAAGRAARR